MSVTPMRGSLSEMDRLDFWADYIRRSELSRIAEIGVWQGAFSEHMLRNCPSITRYYMVDPWRHLPTWNKPMNVKQERFDQIHDQAIARTDFAGEVRTVLRGTTIEVINQIPNGSLDLAYIDGDHTLRGITIDLIRVYPKVSDDGFIAGDDLSASIWHHAPHFEPTMVFPFAIHFAEAMNHPIEVLQDNQFLIRKNRKGFQLIDQEGRYADTALRHQLRYPMRKRLRQLLKRCTTI